MTGEINPSELGAFTNNLPNKEGIKKLCEKVNEGGGTTYTAGDNITINDGVISATDTKYTAGDNIAISEQNVISATDTKYTAGTGISISEQNVISAIGVDSGWTLRTSNNDWSDLFEYENSTMKVKKDIIIYVDLGQNETGCFISYLPKNLTRSSNRVLLGSYNRYEEDNVYVDKCYMYNNNINSDSITKTILKKQFTISNNAISIQGSNSAISFAKSNFVIYTKD